MIDPSIASLHFIWCNLCNAAEAQGKLMAYLVDDDGQPLYDMGLQELDACQKCVDKFKKDEWIDPVTN